MEAGQMSLFTTPTWTQGWGWQELSVFRSQGETITQEWELGGEGVLVFSAMYAWGLNDFKKNFQ